MKPDPTKKNPQKKPHVIPADREELPYIGSLKKIPSHTGTIPYKGHRTHTMLPHLRINLQFFHWRGEKEKITNGEIITYI